MRHRVAFKQVGQHRRAVSDVAYCGQEPSTGGRRDDRSPAPLSIQLLTAHTFSLVVVRSSGFRHLQLGSLGMLSVDELGAWQGGDKLNNVPVRISSTLV